MSTTTYELTGLTCGHCVNAVTEEVSAIDGVTEVKVELVKGGRSTMTVSAEGDVSQEDIASAVDEAGDYQLVDASA